MIINPLSVEKVYSPAGSVPLPSDLTYWTPTKSNLYLDSSLETVVREPALYKLLTFQIQIMSVFHRLCSVSRESVQVRGSFMNFVTNVFLYGEGLLASSPTPKLEDHPLSFVRGCVFNIFAAVLHPQPELDAMLWSQVTHLPRQS
jgi:hypothetical protein